MVRVYGQGSLISSLIMHGRLISDTKVHLSNKSILVVKRVSLEQSDFTVAQPLQATPPLPSAGEKG